MKKTKIGAHELVSKNKAERDFYIKQKLKDAGFDPDKEIRMLNDPMSYNILFEQDDDA